MRNQCEKFISLIPKATLGDLDPGARAELDAHLATCENCRAEQAACSETLQQLAAVEDLPVPRHFFVPANASNRGFFDLLRELILSWRFVAAAAASALVLIGVLGLSNFQFQAQDGVYAFSFGQPLPRLGAQDRTREQIESVRSELISLIDRKLQNERRQYLATLKSELDQSAGRLSATQRRVLQVALNDVEKRMNERVQISEQAVEAKTGRTIRTVYDALQAQRAEDLNRIRTTFTRAQLLDEREQRETQAVLNTLIEVADLKIRKLN